MGFLPDGSIYRDRKFDERAAHNACAAAEKAYRRMCENMLDAQKRIAPLLTPQQRKQLRQVNH